jgi:hypothetical protein
MTYQRTVNPMYSTIINRELATRAFPLPLLSALTGISRLGLTHIMAGVREPKPHELSAFSFALEVCLEEFGALSRADCRCPDHAKAGE